MSLRKCKSIFQEGSFPVWMGMRLLDCWENGARVEMKICQHHLRINGIAHGGAISALADHTFGTAIMGSAKENEKYATIEMSVNYLESVKEGIVVAECQIVRRGKKISVGTVKVHQGEKLVAFVVCTCLRNFIEGR